MIDLLNGQEKISELLKKFPQSEKVLAKFGLTKEAEEHFHYRNVAHAAIVQKLSLRKILEELSEVTGEKIAEIKVQGVAAPLKPGFRHGTPGGIKRTIAIHSGKGGVGKTFVAVNLAATLATQGFRVGLLDADIDCPNVMEVLKLSGKLLADEHGKIVPLEKFGMKIVSMAPLLEHDDQALMWRGPIISRVIEQFVQDVNWGELDFLVVDLPAGTGDAPLTLLQILDKPQLIIVTTPQSLALLDAKKSISMAKRLNVPILGLVENMTGKIFGETGKQTAAELGVRLLGQLEMRSGYTKIAADGSPAVQNFLKLLREFKKISRLIGG